jgi:serine/threonine-protein kinase RsbW
MHSELILKNRREELLRLHQWIDQLAVSISLPAAVEAAIRLALEELVTNIINYGFPENVEQDIILHVHADSASLDLVIEDSGIPFNPLSYPPPDLTLPLEERPIGGLGIHIVRNNMDGVSYKLSGGRNILQLSKKLAARANRSQLS